jgi:hypothetical protein
MKTLIALSLVIATGPAAAMDLAETAALQSDSYYSVQRFRDMQMTKMQNLLGDLYQKTGGKPVNYNTYSGTFKFEVDNLQVQIANASTSIEGTSVRVSTTSQNLETQIANRRERYFKTLREIAKSDPEAAKSMKLRADVARDVRFAQATKDLNPKEFQRALKHYEGGKFGEGIEQKSQIEGIDTNSTKQIKVKTYHSQTEVSVKPGDQLRITTTTGDLVAGKVVGTLPNGKVVIQNEPPFGLEVDMPEMARGRIIDLNEAADVKLYSGGSERPAEISVRYQAADIKEAIRQNRLTELSQKPKANGEVAEINPVKATIIDKKAGEAIRIDNSFGPGNAIR